MAHKFVHMAHKFANDPYNMGHLRIYKKIRSCILLIFLDVFPGIALLRTNCIKY